MGGGPWEAVGGSLGRARVAPDNTAGFFRVSWRGSGGPTEVILVVWGWPGGRPGRWKCSYFSGFKGVLGKGVFFKFFIDIDMQFAF